MLSAREIVKQMIVDKAGTDEASTALMEAAVDVVLSVSEVRRCWTCGNIALHRDNVTPYVLCSKCKSQDTRRIR